MRDLVEKVIKWSDEKGILEQSTSHQQFEKLIEEVFELHEALILGDKAAIVDAIGDCQVCLINVAELEELDYVGCLEDAYDVIKDRKGRMVNGKFEKDA
jgi:NTP pyrophosphatase (non-canonical NTP hydrolase)